MSVNSPAPDFAGCLPSVGDLDWNLMAETPFVLLGAGAVGRPLANNLAFLGMKRCTVVDRKAYRPQSVVSQCDPHDVGRAKAAVVDEKLQALGVAATAREADIEELPHGIIERNAVVVAALDNRRADILANRLTAMMRARLVKVNVEPAFLAAAVRFYDLTSPLPPVCAECRMTDGHYQSQRHPLSCDGGGPEQSTGSPRPLCEFAANAAALAIAQIVCSPERWANVWLGTHWQHTLLGGRSTRSRLDPNPVCRCDHSAHWRNLRFLSAGPDRLTLADLFRLARLPPQGATQIRPSHKIATAARCAACGARQGHIFHWVSRLDQPVGTCGCGGQLQAEPFSVVSAVPAARLQDVFDLPLSRWGVPCHAVLAIETPEVTVSFALGVGNE